MGCFGMDQGRDCQQVRHIVALEYTSDCKCKDIQMVIEWTNRTVQVGSPCSIDLDTRFA